MIDPFVYVPPTPETAPRYAAIRAAAEAASAVIRQVLAYPWWEKQHAAHHDAAAGYAAINNACRGLYTVIAELVPDGADKSAALRCARVARMAANEVNTPVEGAWTSLAKWDRVRRADVALTQIDMARWQACAAIALAPPSTAAPIGGAE